MPRTAATPAVLPAAQLDAALAGDIDVVTWARETTRRYGIQADHTPTDAFAEAVSRLSDAEVPLDPVERLLLAIERAGLVTGREGVLLHAAYLRQRG